MINNIKEMILNNGGVTLNAKFEAVENKNGYCVSLLGTEKTLIKDKLNTETLETILNEYKALLKGTSKRFIGVWYNAEDNKLYFDISVIIEDKKQALKVAKANKQIAVFDLNNGKEIKVIYGYMYNLYNVIYDSNNDIIDFVYNKEVYNTNTRIKIFDSIEDIKSDFIDKMLIIKDKLYYNDMIEM